MFLAIKDARYSRPGVRMSVILVSFVVTGSSTPSSIVFPSVGIRVMLYEIFLAAQTSGGRLQLICTAPFASNDTWMLSGGSS
jgi:hypothetical protein